MAAEVSAFVKRLHEDSTFLNRFAADPAAVLSEAGIDVDAFALPKKIDGAALAAKLSDLFSGKSGTPGGGGKDLAGLNPDELWDRYGAIAWKPTEGTKSGAAVMAVIYGVAICLAKSNEDAQGNNAGIMSVEQVAGLRGLARQPLHQLTFSVTGPDGTRVERLTSAALQAFLARTK